VNNTADDVALDKLSSPAIVEEAQQFSPSDNDIDLNDLVKEAEAHYAQGCEYYQQGDWALAEQAFDLALETLLDADVDAEAHYKLGKAYNTLFYNIHKFALKQSYLTQTELEAAEATKIEPIVLEPLPQEMPIEAVTQISDSSPSYPEDILGTFHLDPSDAEILKYVKQFSHEKSQYRKGIERAGKYLPMIRTIFAEYKLPQELMYIPLIESNFRVDAVSPTGAMGLWQFVRTTGKVYGLKIDKWVDERRDPEKATIAAAKYLSDLYDMLGDWDLAMSGYYMGEYKVHKAIGQHRTRDIIALAQTKTFGSGAKKYVNRIKAATLMAMHPEEYGLDIEASAPLRYDTIDVVKGKRLTDIARQLGVSSNQLKELNPELKTSTIPPGSGQYTLKVPPGAGLIMVAEKTTQPAASKTVASTAASNGDYIIHRVSRGETLAKIARQYGVDVYSLQGFNNISDARTLQIGQKLKVPTSEMTIAARTEVITHIVEKGETLDRIAKRYNVSTSKLQAYNNIRNVRRLQIGQALKVPLPSSSVLAKTQEKRMLTYQVKRGDSLSKIASTFGVSVSQLKEWNNVEGSLIYPGSRIKVWY
jgi:membrane-bound lytic murein transglycosylase D